MRKPSRYKRITRMICKTVTAACALMVNNCRVNATMGSKAEVATRKKNPNVCMEGANMLVKIKDHVLSEFLQQISPLSFPIWAPNGLGFSFIILFVCLFYLNKMRLNFFI